MAWIYLWLAGVFEIGFAIGLKYTAGFSRLLPSLLTVVAAAISLWLLTQALRTIPLGTAYAIWTGIGAIGVTVLGIVLFFRIHRDAATAVHRRDRGRRDRPEADLGRLTAGAGVGSRIS